MSCELIITPKLMKMSKVTKDVKRSNYLSTNQEISLIMIGFLLDPHLVKYFIDILASVELEDAREFHQSLRDISAVNSAAIPICNRLWRTHVELFKYISYTRQGFIQLEGDLAVGHVFLEAYSLSDKIKILNQLTQPAANLKAVQSAFTIFSEIMDRQPTDINTENLNDEDYHDITFLCSGLDGSITIYQD